MSESHPVAGVRPGPAVARLLWDLREAAQALNISERSLKRMAAARELPGDAVVRLGRRQLFVRAALERWIAAGCPPPRRPRP
jgi:excisionase family DNA binding protein